MTSNIVNQVAYLRTSREFPEEIDKLTVELDKCYMDIANTINNRIIGIFPTKRPAINGEGWFLAGRKQQGLRQVYTFTTTAVIPHGLKLDQLDRFTRCFGAYTDRPPGLNWYGLIFGSNVVIPGQISFYIDPTNIVFLVGAGAPAVVKGQVVLEWISEV